MTTHLDPARVPPPQGPREDPHRSLHSETGARPGEHPGRSKNPLVKAAGLAFQVWTIDDAAVAKRMIEWGAESVTTNKAAWLKGQVK